MGENQESREMIQKPQTDLILGIPKKEIVDELVWPYIKSELKKQAGISTDHLKTTGKNNTAYSRFLGASKEFLQGTWWIFPLLILGIGLSAGITWILIKWISKMAGV